LTDHAAGADLSASGPLDAYYQLVSKGDIEQDENQLQLMEKLQLLCDDLVSYDLKRPSGMIQTPIVASSPPATESSSTLEEPQRKGWLDMFFGGRGGGNDNGKRGNIRGIKSKMVPYEQSYSTSSSYSNVPRSLYVHGGTGCGKTFMMDLFYDTLPIARKKRVHFHNFMIDIHKRLHRIRRQQQQEKEAAEASAEGGIAYVSPEAARERVASWGKNNSVFGSTTSRARYQTTGSVVETAAQNYAVEKITDELIQEAYLLCFDGEFNRSYHYVFAIACASATFLFSSLLTSLFPYDYFHCSLCHLACHGHFWAGINYNTRISGWFGNLWFIIL
jgi:predicted ATPase